MSDRFCSLNYHKAVKGEYDAYSLCGDCERGKEMFALVGVGNRKRSGFLTAAVRGGESTRAKHEKAKVDRPRKKAHYDNRICIICGDEYTPANTMQERCERCKEIRRREHDLKRKLSPAELALLDDLEARHETEIYAGGLDRRTEEGKPLRNLIDTLEGR